MFKCHGYGGTSFKSISLRAFISSNNNINGQISETRSYFIATIDGVDKGINFVPNINGIDIDYKDGDVNILNCKFMFLRTAVRMKGHDIFIKDSNFILSATGIKLEIPIDGRLDLVHIYGCHFHSMALNGAWLNTSIYGRGIDSWDANTGFTDELACIRLPDSMKFISGKD